MPEGDTIHKLAAALDAELRGRPLRFASVEGQVLTSFEGRTVDRVVAHGKHLFVLVEARALRTHLGMRGKWLRRSRVGEPARSLDSAVLVTDVVELRCVGAREVEVLDVRSPRYRRFADWLGPDLARSDSDLDAAIVRARQLAAPTAPLVDVLLEQRIAAGIGNVYKSEVLFLTRLHPLLELGSIDDATLRSVLGRARELLRRNLRPGPRRTRAPRPARTALRDPDDPALWVYGRHGEPCSVCGTVIEFARLGRHHRGTWWCPKCQPRPLSRT